jgi:UDP-N-acetylglucosamine transferase subunit ALG13
LFCCSNDNDSIYQSTKIIFTEIGQGFTELNDNLAQNLIITTETEWNILMDNLPSEFVDNFNEININFNEFIIIAVITENQPNTGYSVSVNEIIENKNSINVFSEIQYTGSGYTRIVQPFHIVKIPSTNKEIVFE